MPAYQQEHKGRAVSPQEQPLSAAVETLAASLDRPLFGYENGATQFRFGILVVDETSQYVKRQG